MDTHAEWIVGAGPFRRLAYVRESAGSALTPKLLGTYERELHAVIEAIIARRPRRLVNIGCGEGYYAVGFAWRLQEVEIDAFDVDPRARELCAELAQTNGVGGRVRIHGLCTVQELARVVTPRSVVICDCEGAEVDLLDPERVPALRTGEMVVELHEHEQHGCTELIVGRFRETHEIEIIPAEEGDPAAAEAWLADGGASDEVLAWWRGLTHEERREAVNEQRPPGMAWAHMTPRAGVQEVGQMDSGQGAGARDQVPGVRDQGAKGKTRKPRAGKMPGLPGPTGAPTADTPIPTPDTRPLITAVILARNEESRLPGALDCLEGWTDQVIVIDNESEDRTAEIARERGALVLSAPRAANFDAARMLAVPHAVGEWIYVLDADERVPTGLGPALRRLVAENGDEFAAVSLPFRSYFCGKWIQHCGWWPGYTRPQLLKKGCFRYGERLHSGVAVDGTTMRLPPDHPGGAVDHYSYDTVRHYLTKLNSYTSGEADNLRDAGGSHSWRGQLSSFVRDWMAYYDRGHAPGDGMHGFVLAFLSAAYRLVSRAKLWDLRRQQAETGSEEPVPASVDEMLAFMADVAREGLDRWVEPDSHDAGSGPRSIPLDWLPSVPALETYAERNPEPAASGITACILARNEEHRIERALLSLRGWTDRIVVIDNDSDDNTAEVARRYADLVLTAPRAANFDALRHMALEHVQGEWVFYLDADERVPARLAETLVRLVGERGDSFDALMLPSRNIVCGKWLSSPAWWPGYSRPYLLRKGAFRYGERLHSGVQVFGRTLKCPSDDPDSAVLHESVPDIAAYIDKLNAYTDAEAENMLHDGADHSWQAQLGDFARDWRTHYDELRAREDGMHGFVFSFLCAFYRFVARAKLWDLRQQQGLAGPPGPLPSGVAEMISFMAGGSRVVGAPAPPATASQASRLPLIWSAPLRDPSGYADEARNFVLALVEAGEPVAVAPIEWNAADAGLAPEVEALVAERTVPRGAPCAIFVSQSTPPLNRPSPNALVNVARTMFETDRLCPGWEQVLNRMDRVWVPSEFNRATFARSGVDPAKLAVIPGALDPAPFAADAEPWPVPGCEPFRFLSVFDWSLHKGWDVLLLAFAAEFGGDPSVGLVIKTWSSHGHTPEVIRDQADQLLRERTGRRLGAYPSIHIWHEHLPVGALPRLYRAVQAFVLPSRGEGWCRPLAEAMASGLPTIATAWSGITAFHDAKVGYPVRCTIVPVSEAGGREIPIYAGHCWAEPSVSDLRQRMREVVTQPAEAGRRGQAARHRIREKYSRHAVVQVLRAELAVCRALAQSRAASEPPPPVRDAILIQTASGEHVQFLEATRDHHARYAHRHGMDFVCRTGPQVVGRAPTWDKVVLIRAALAKGTYRHIFWLDADTLITDPGRDLRDALPTDAWMGMVKHDARLPSRASWYNAGAIYLRAVPEAARFFEEVWDAWPVEHVWEDNMAIIMVLGYRPERWRGVAVLDDEWNSTHGVNESPHPVIMGWHGGGPVAARIESMRRALMTLRERPGGSPGSEEGREQLAMPMMPAANPVPLDSVAPVDFRTALGRPLRVRWEGDQFILSSLALVNREMCLGLLARTDVEISIATEMNPWHTRTEHAEPRLALLRQRLDAPLSGPPDIVVRHHWPPDWRPPAEGKLVVMQPWELSHLPRTDWIEGATYGAAEVWANSRFVRDTFVRSGVPAEKVAVVPEGVRPDTYRAAGPSGLPSCVDAATADRVARARTRFVFVGGATKRKGADLLLPAFRAAFGSSADVALIVKDMGAKTFYRGETMRDALLAAQGETGHPPVAYIDDELTDDKLAALYRYCSCLVLPTRGEGFGLPPLEAMACGLPVIVPAGAACDDYLDDTTAYRIPFRRVMLPGQFKDPPAAPFTPWQNEPDMDNLVQALRWVHEHPEEARARGAAGRARVEAGWTWDRATAIACERMLRLVEAHKPAATPVAVEWSVGSGQADAAPTSAAAKTRRRKPAISLCVIARNEEPRIGHCLASAKPYVDEMIVLDTGSTDRTREVAAEHGARVYEAPWPDSFAAARNGTIELARGRYIFVMDADDVLLAESGQLLRELVKKHPGSDAAFNAQVRIPPGPNEFSPSAVDHVKLFPKRPDIRYEFRIHEQVLPSLRRARLPVLPSDLYVVHEHYDRSPEGQARKRVRDFRLLDLDLRDRPNHPFVLFNLGMTYLLATREYEAAAQCLRRSLDGSDWRDSIVRKAYALLTTTRVCQEEWAQAIAANEEGRSHYPDDAELLFLGGQTYQRLDRFDEARAALERLVKGADDAQFRSCDVGLRTYRGRHELALLFGRMGSLRHCAEMLAEVAEQWPEYLPARVELAGALMRMDRRVEARYVLAALPPVPAIAGEVGRLWRALGDSPGPRRDGPIQARPAAFAVPTWDRAPRFGRRDTTMATLRLLCQRHPGPARIVELGALRCDGPGAQDGDGWSTLAWAWYSSEVGGRLTTVDIDPAHMAVCRRATAGYAPWVEYVVADSVEYLLGLAPSDADLIDLLYLDSVDYEDRPASEAHCLAEAQAALPHLGARSLVLIDDTPYDHDQPPNGTAGLTGKGALAVPFLLSHGFRIEFAQDNQTLLARM